MRFDILVAPTETKKSRSKKTPTIRSLIEASTSDIPAPTAPPKRKTLHKKISSFISRKKKSVSKSKQTNKAPALGDSEPTTKPATEIHFDMDQNVSNLSSDVSDNNNAPSNLSEPSQVNAGNANIINSFSLNSHLDFDAEDSEMNISRLQTILETRGFSPHFLGPRVQNILYRSLNNSSNSKAQQLLHALNSTASETEKLQHVLEMCQLLLMGNEDTLVGFPIKSVVPTLINLLSMEDNFEIMHHSCRALTYMMEALPRSSVIILDAVPVFLDKLQSIQCMDVAEQSLSALEMLSRRHNKAILQARGVSACLTYLDFFSIDAQRSALTITANCFQNLASDDFQSIQDTLPILSCHLTINDKKCIESICLAFSRLVDCYQHDSAIISEIASCELLSNIQTVLMTVPMILSTGSFVIVIRMLSIMCRSCPQIAVDLLKLSKLMK